jgi:putative ABC transport system permease protein
MLFSEPSVALLSRPRADGLTRRLLAPGVRPMVGIVENVPLDEGVRHVGFVRAFTMLTLAVAAFLALVLGTLGLYSVLSHVVAERTREIGVRMALGAEAGRVRWMVVGQGARVLGLGIALGLGVALVTTRFLARMLYGVAAVDPVTFGATAAVLAGVGLLAAYLPARRASRVDPVESMRAG